MKNNRFSSQQKLNVNFKGYYFPLIMEGKIELREFQRGLQLFNFKCMLVWIY